jgi:hypothetical protein
VPIKERKETKKKMHLCGGKLSKTLQEKLSCLPRTGAVR